MELEVIELEKNKVETPVIDLNGEYLTEKEYFTNPAIARDSEIKKLIIVLLTPEKSGLLVGKAGIGKTAIVEGLAHRIRKNEVPDKLKGYHILKFSSSSLVGKMEKDGQEQMIMNVFINEVKKLKNVIIFIDEIHTLMGGKKDGPMDLANILKPVIDRGDVKVIGATTSEEYYAYIIRDRAFLRRFEKIDVVEPDFATTVKILLGTIPKIEKQTGVTFRYREYVAQQVIESIVDATSEFKRIYGLSAMYPDIAFSVLTQAFSQALFKNKTEVNLLDVYEAIKTSKRIYPDSIVKELEIFRNKFYELSQKEQIELPLVTLDDVEKTPDYI